MLILSFIVSALLYVLSFVLSVKIKNKNKLSAFECGFAGVGTIHSSFSIHYFSILLVFVLFDLEIVLLVGVLLTINKVGTFMLIVFITLGMYFEWYSGKLAWVV